MADIPFTDCLANPKLLMSFSSAGTFAWPGPQTVQATRTPRYRYPGSCSLSLTKPVDGPFGHVRCQFNGFHRGDGRVPSPGCSSSLAVVVGIVHGHLASAEAAVRCPATEHKRSGCPTRCHWLQQGPPPPATAFDPLTASTGLAHIRQRTCCAHQNNNVSGVLHCTLDCRARQIAGEVPLTRKPQLASIPVTAD